MKNYRYHIIRENYDGQVSTHRNPVEAFKSAERLAKEYPQGFGVRDTKTGGFYIAGTEDFRLAYAAAKEGCRDFPPIPKGAEEKPGYPSAATPPVGGN